MLSEAKHLVIARGASLVAINRVRHSWTVDCFASLAMTKIAHAKFSIVIANEHNVRAWQSNMWDNQHVRLLRLRLAMTWKMSIAWGKLAQ